MAESIPPTDVKIIHEPTVYVMGRQSVNDEEIDRFLADHGVSWQTDTEVAGEHLVETAGRICYMSFARPRPGGNQAYLGHILEVGHGSVLEHAVWNLLFTGVSRSLTHELIRHRAGFGYCLTGDTLVYSDHFDRGLRCGTKKRSIRELYEKTKTPHGRSRLKLLRPRCLDEATMTFVQGKVNQVVYSGQKPVFRVELEDGKNITCSKDHRFLTQQGWKPLHEIVGGLEVSSGGLAVYGSLDELIATNGVLAYRDKKWLLEHYHERGLAQEEIAELAGVSTHTIRAWIRKHVECHHVLPIWARPDLALEITNLVALCEPCHLQVNQHELEYAEQFGAAKPDIQALADRQPNRGRGNALTPRFRKIRFLTYEGLQDTYDLEMEGPNHNFVANGFVTHNSQLSQRYVDESIAEYVEPDCIANDPELHRLWLEAVANTHRAYMQLTEKLLKVFESEPDKTLRRKLARQAARSVLPNATETKIFVTANARALRHFIELRGNRHAETEIRKLAIAVLRILQHEAPNLFGDYQLVPLPDGTFEASTPYRKV